MAKLFEEAQAYEPPATKNIADLPKIPTDLDVVVKEFTKEDGSTFKIKVVSLNGEDYRVPNTVLSSLKEILVEKPTLKFFKVKKSGEGLKTKYTVITLD